MYQSTVSSTITQRVQHKGFMKLTSGYVDLIHKKDNFLSSGLETARIALKTPPIERYDFSDSKLYLEFFSNSEKKNRVRKKKTTLVNQ